MDEPINVKIEVDATVLIALQKQLGVLDTKTGNQIIRSIGRKHMWTLANFLRQTFPRSGNGPVAFKRAGKKAGGKPAKAKHTADLISVRSGKSSKSLVGLTVATPDANFIQKFLEFGVKMKSGAWRIKPRFYFIEAFKQHGQKISDGIIRDVTAEVDKALNS